VEGNNVRIVNSAIYAMQMLQDAMEGESKKTNLTTEDAIMTLVKEVRTKSEYL